MNIAYSYPPFRIRNKPISRACLIFLLNFIKSWLILLYLQQPLTNFPLPIIALGASAMAFGQTFYKRYLGGNKVAEAAFGIIFIISWIWTIVSYREVFWLYFPIMPLLLFVGFKYKTKQVPLGTLQNVYFLYSIFIYILHLHS